MGADIEPVAYCGMGSCVVFLARIRSFILKHGVEPGSKNDVLIIMNDLPGSRLYRLLLKCILLHECVFMLTSSKERK